MYSKTLLANAALMGFIGVLTQALGAHALRPELEARAAVEIFQLASQFLLFHAPTLLALVLLMQRWPAAGYGLAAVAVAVGTWLFAGTLLLRSFGHLGPLGRLTPLGGGLLMLGWLAMLVAALRSGQGSQPKS